MNHYHYLNPRVLLLGGSIAAGSFLFGQAVEDDQIFELSPFEVSAVEDQGYGATQTLAGTRLRTDLRDIASAISVTTAQFLKDTNSNSTEDLLVYTTNTEVGGVYGNFSGMGGSSTYNERDNLLRPNSNTRVRGLDSADNTRDYFLSEIPWDSYAIDRVEIQRGPNSVLFGIGSPAGIINTTMKTAVYQDITDVGLGYGSFGTHRGTFDINREIIDKEFAIRILGVYDEEKFRQDPAFETDKRLFGALRYEPKLFGRGSFTSIRANYEHGDVEANRPRSLPPIDTITPWFRSGETNGIPNMNKLTLDPNTTWNAWGNNEDWPSFTYPWFREAFMARMFNSDIGAFYDGATGDPYLYMTPSVGTSNGRAPDGSIDGTIDPGIPFGRLWGIATYNNYARTAIPGGKYYSNVSIDDKSIYNFYNKLMDGPNKKEWQDWDTFNISLSQTFLNNRIGAEIVYFEQDYSDGQHIFLEGDQYQLSVDINTHLMSGAPNPNVGRPYVGNSGQYGNYMYDIDRESWRVTAFGEFRFTDVPEESMLTKILGRHILTGLFSDDQREEGTRQFSRWASELAFTDATGGIQDITNGHRQFSYVAYVGPSLMGASSASGAKIGNVKARINPSAGPLPVWFFDSNWNAPGVAFDAPFSTYVNDSDGVPQLTESTQSENPANYVGWRNSTFSVLDAAKGDIRDLYSSVTFRRNTIESVGITLQSYLIDENLVFTYGWREDEVENIPFQGRKLEHDVSDPTDLVRTGNPRKTKGQTRTWGLVLHSPDFINERLPGNSRISLFYNEGENFKADAPRGDIFGQQIANPTGETEDYGIVLSTLEDRLIVKVTRYETTVSDATLAADSAGFSGNLYYAWALPYWGATHALAALDGIADPQIRQGNWGWPWNGIALDADGNPDNARIREIAEDFFASFPLDQNFADEYGLGMDVAAMRAAATDAQRYASVPTYGVDGQGASSLGLQPEFAGNLKSFGSGPVASVDSTSKGYEVEITARLTPNWDMTVNFSKTDATRTAISPSIDAWINSFTEFMNRDAGLIRLWGGDTLRANWENNILAPYAVLQAQLGSDAPEIAPWRFNLITNYRFDDGALEGINVGMAYRWEDERILGYKYDAANDILDIKQPWYGDSEDHFDLWIGYQTDLKWNNVRMRIQLNVRNVGESASLVPVTIQPDGSVALSRIQEGTTYMLTTTFSF